MLDNKSPAEEAGIYLNSDNKWLQLIHNIEKNKKQQGKS